VSPSIEETNEGVKTTEICRGGKRKLPYDYLNERSTVVPSPIQAGVDEETKKTMAVPGVGGSNKRLNFETTRDRYSDGALTLPSSQAIPTGTFGTASTTSSSQWWLSKAPFSSFGPHSSQQQRSAGAESLNISMPQAAPEAGLDSMLSKFWDFQQEIIAEEEEWISEGGASLPLPWSIPCSSTTTIIMWRQ
jgi:hypothetical protein